MTTNPPSLKDRIRNLIRADGPIPLSVYMQLALHDRQQGYYATRPGLGEDFTTAPETSQVFGEMLGLWTAHEWKILGAPSPFHLVELGPGRGVMMQDAWRAASSVQSFTDAANLSLVEPSPALRKVQASRLSEAAATWRDDLGDVPEGPTILLANEMLDCLPARQFVRQKNQWYERLVGLDDAGNLVLGLSSAPTPSEDAPAAVQDVIEISPALDTMADLVAARLMTHPGRALFIDYGPAACAPGDTVRAFEQGQQVDPLADPGNADITVDVDFSAFAAHARARGLTVHGPTPQGLFLSMLGAEARVNALMNANPETADDIAARATRLMSSAEMGERFKVICLSSPGLPPPAGFPSA